MADEVSNEIEEMIGALSVQSEAPKEEVVVESPKEEPKVEEPKPEVKEEVKEEASKGEVIEDKPVVEEVVKPEPIIEPVVAAEDPRISAMQATINEMAQRLLQAGQPAVVQPQAQQAPDAQVDLDFTKFQILPEGVDFEDVVNDKASFEKFMRDLLGRYEVTRVRRDMLATPTLVSKQVQQSLGLHEVVRVFYDNNKDLLPVRPLVGAFSTKFVAEHPDWSLPQVLEESAKAARAALGFQGGVKPVVPNPTPPKKEVNPSFATTNATRNTTPSVKKDKLTAEIEDLLVDY